MDSVSLRAVLVAALLIPSARPSTSLPWKGSDGPAREQGQIGTLPARIGELRLQDALVHQDVHGGNLQALQVLAGGSGGVVAVWRDHRDGMMGLYLRRLDATAAGREPEQPIHAPHSGRRRDPALAFAADGSGAVAWTSVSGGKNTVFLRTFDPAGQFLGPDLTLEAPSEARAPGADESVRESGDRQPALAITADGRVVVAWNRNGSVVLQEFDARGKPRAGARVLNPDVDPAALAGSIRLAGLDRDALCVWSTRSGSAVLARRSAGKETRLGEGFLDAVVPAAGGGAWIATHAATATKELRLVRVDATGKPVRDSERRLELAFPPQRAELASGPSGLVVVVEGTGGATNASTRSRAAPPASSVGLAAYHARSEGEFVPLPLDGLLEAGLPTTTDLRVASAGSAFVFAWTDERDVEPNVFARSYDPSAAERFGPVRRMNSDAASADQSRGRVAAHGEHAVVVWHDGRDVAERIFARRISTNGLQGDEFELPRGEAIQGPRRPARQLPAVAMQADGRFAVAWREIVDGSESLHVQVIDGDDRAPSSTAIDPGQRTFGSLPCSIAALPDGRGYALAWPRPGGSVFARRLRLDGGGTGEPVLVGSSSGAESPNTSLCVLDDGRLVCAWDVQPSGRDASPSLRARFLDLEMQPLGDELRFEPSIFGKDWDPCVAPAPKGGFVMAWCAGAPNDPGRDVFARAFDARGRPDGPFLPITTVSNEQDWPEIVRLEDGSWLVAWEDDLSYYDQTIVRRILPSKRELGPARSMNQTETRSVPDRVFPSIAAWRGGFVGAWGDRRRSLGWDVYVCAAGPAFDGARKH